MDRQTYACGTTWINRGEFPRQFKEAKLDASKSLFISMDSIVSVHWKDKRDVFAMSFHGNQETTIKRHHGEVQKPVMIQSYNENMGGVDQFDQRLSYYSLNHKSTKWWKRSDSDYLKVVISQSTYFKKISRFFTFFGIYNSLIISINTCGNCVFFLVCFIVSMFC